MLTDPGACPLDVDFAEGERHCAKFLAEISCSLNSFKGGGVHRYL